MLRIIYLLLPVLLFSAHISSVLAELICTNKPDGPSELAITLPSNITIPPGTSTGQIIWSSQSRYTQSSSIACNQKWHSVIGYAPGVMLAPTAITDVYATNVPGIGVSVTAFDRFMPLPGTALRLNTYNPAGTLLSLPMSINLIVTGPVGEGTLTLPSPLAGGYASASPDNLVEAWPYGQLTIQGRTEVTLSNCKTSNVKVNMGATLIQKLAGGNGATTKSIPFAIYLDCPPGLKGVWYELQPITSIIAGTASVLTLDASSGATGVGVQILDNNDTPLTAAKGFGTGNAVPLGSIPGSTTYNNSTATTYKIPLRARYYRTEGTLSPGVANTGMIFMLTYY